MIVLAGMIAPTEQNGRTQTRHRESTVGTINQISAIMTNQGNPAQSRQINQSHINPIQL
jgi:hypothetical protein